MKATIENTTALILAGGQGRRMNYSDKGLLTWHEQPLIAHVIAAIKPQLNTIIISANQNLDQYRQFGYPLVSDNRQEFQGPLAGILSAMKQFSSDYFCVIPCDCPTPPADLFNRLSTALNSQSDSPIAIADDGNRSQPLFGLYAKKLLPALDEAISTNKNKVMQFVEDNNAIKVDFSDQADAFINFNQPEDMH